MDEIIIQYRVEDNYGILLNNNLTPNSGIWNRLSSSALNIDYNALININQIGLPWYKILALLREYSSLQKQLHFRFKTDKSSQQLIEKFLQEQRSQKQAQAGSIIKLTEDDVQDKLSSLGFTKRSLRKFQLRDVSRLLSLPNGANFSVPGAGKTTSTLAIHLLTTKPEDKLFVVGPKASFTAWAEIIELCIESRFIDAYNTGKFTNVSGLKDDDIIALFNTDRRYFITNYEHFVSRKDVFAYLLATMSIHLVLDESHRMKAGQNSLRGAALLSIANLPKRKDILSGTPMPQGPQDLQSQIDFLWPGSSLGSRISNGENPSEVINGLYSRTTKNELGLPPVNRTFIQVPMSNAQAALYGIVRNDVLRQLSSFRDGKGLDIIRARKSVMRLLQLASNPILAIRGISQDIFMSDSGVINAVIQNPTSPKVQEVVRLVRQNAKENKKTVVWTIFTQNILDLERQLGDLNPVSLYGSIRSGEPEDLETREGRLRRFHEDESCMVIIANPAAAGEGISLHEVCHDAIYLDRSYVSTHYLQSIDRIHRLGLPASTVTNVTIIQASTPMGLGSIDYSVSRRLATKIRALQQLLDDEDLHEIALDEENVQDAVDFNLSQDDVADLIEELEGTKAFNQSEGI
jgi:SNF2 family DNA or RNA helicase